MAESIRLDNLPFDFNPALQHQLTEADLKGDHNGRVSKEELDCTPKTGGYFLRLV